MTTIEKKQLEKEDYVKPETKKFDPAVIVREGSECDGGGECALYYTYYY